MLIFFVRGGCHVLSCSAVPTVGGLLNVVQPFLPQRVITSLYFTLLDCCGGFPPPRVFPPEMAGSRMLERSFQLPVYWLDVAKSVFVGIPSLSSSLMTPKVSLGFSDLLG